jgi:hypothetical protein
MTLHCCFIGCDIAKRHLDLFDEASGRSLRIANTAAALAAWLSELDTAAAFVAFEAAPTSRRWGRAGTGRLPLRPDQPGADAAASGAPSTWPR